MNTFKTAYNVRILQSLHVRICLKNGTLMIFQFHNIRETGNSIFRNKNISDIGFWAFSSAIFTRWNLLNNYKSCLMDSWSLFFLVTARIEELGHSFTFYKEEKILKLKRRWVHFTKTQKCWNKERESIKREFSFELELFWWASRYKPVTFNTTQ